MKDSSRPRLCETVVTAFRACVNPDGMCELSLHNLSRVTGYSRRSVIQAIKGLVALGAIVVHRRYASDGTQLCNAYRLTAELAKSTSKRGAACHVT